MSIAVLLAGAARGVCLQAASPYRTASIELGESVVRLNGPWRFHTGDDAAWAQPGFDDSAWESVDLSPLKGGADPLLGTSYKPGWTGSGHPGYHGYAWYRLRVHLAQPPSGPTRLLMPENVDDGYEVYVNGRRTMSFGDFSSHPPKVFLSDQVVASAMPGATDLTIAIRFWMSAWTVQRYRNAGGLHAPPAFGLASAVGLAEAALMYSVLRISVVTTLKALSLLCLAAFALLLYSQDRSERFSCLLGIAALLEAALSLLVVAGGTTYLFDMATVWRLQVIVLYPAITAAWACVWIEWFGLRHYRWLSNCVWALAMATVILRFLHLDPAAPHASGAWAAAVTSLDYWVRVGAGLLFVAIMVLGVRLCGREGWPALIVALLRSASLLSADLALYRVTLNWFPAGFRVQFFDLTGFLMVGALSIAVLQRFVRAQRRTHELTLRRDEAERATRAKSEFLAVMSHEIRTPLNAIIGMADVLSGTPLNAEQKRCLEVSQRNGVGLLTLINDILDLSKVESGNVELESVPMDLREVMAGAMEVVEGRASAKALWLHQNVAGGVPVHLIGDPNRLRQVIINLLGNAIKFTERGGMEVTAEPDPEDTRPGCLRFAVADTGIGIPKEKLGTVFESFAQAESSTTRQYGGTGLGLSISRQLVELMGGRIWAESVVGEGSTFFFTVKLQVQEDQTERPQAETSAVSLDELERRAGGLRILLADDSADNRFLVLSYLRETWAAVDIAENGEAAVESFRRNGSYDVVLMDVEMPVMDGYTATREIRRIERDTGAAPTPVLALTAHAFADMAARGFEAGFTDLLTKPIRKTTLLEALARHRKTAPAAKKRVRVAVEEGMEDVVPAYLEKRRAEIAVYRQALDQADFAPVRRLAHNMKGTGAGYGFATLTELGSAIEEAAKRENEADARAAVEELAAWLASVDLECAPLKNGGHLQAGGVA